MKSKQLSTGRRAKGSRDSARRLAIREAQTEHELLVSSRTGIVEVRQSASRNALGSIAAVVKTFVTLTPDFRDFRHSLLCR